MKPTSQFNDKSRCDFSERESRKSSVFPHTDYNFQAASVAHGGSRCFVSCGPSLREISRDYFENEEPRSFATEAALFSVLMITVIVPILNSASVLAHLLRSLGTW